MNQCKTGETVITSVKFSVDAVPKMMMWCTEGESSSKLYVELSGTKTNMQVVILKALTSKAIIKLRSSKVCFYLVINGVLELQN